MGNPIPATSVVPAGVHAVQQASAGTMTRGEAKLLRDVITRGLDENDMHVYAAICRHTGLDPFKRQIYAWKDKGKLTIHIAINGWRGIAARTGMYGGQDGPYWAGPDGVWRDVWLEDGPPAAARVGVRRSGFSEPIYSTATWKEFERTKKRTGANGPTPWDDKPAHMLAIRAEYQALQRACPEAFEGALATMASARADYQIVDEDEIPAALESPSVDTETGEITETLAPAAPEPTPPPEPDWTRFKTLLDEAALTMRDLTPVLGVAPSKANWKAEITEWLADGGGRDFDDLIRLALDELAGPTESGE